MVLITFKFDMAQAAAGRLSLVVWHGSHVDRAKGSNSLSVPAGTMVTLSTRPYGVLWVVFATVWTVPGGTMDTSD